MKPKDIKLNVRADISDFETALAQVKKSIEELNKAKIFVNIETRTIEPKKWYQFWR